MEDDRLEREKPWIYGDPQDKRIRQRDTHGRVTDRPPTHPDELPIFSSSLSLAIIIFISLVYVTWGFFVFQTVGSKWPPPWNFGELQDLPGASIYSTEMGRRFPGAAPERLESAPPNPQHVRERPPTTVLNAD
jgi:hypothetical protein